jgi:hypothetical protein
LDIFYQFIPPSAGRVAKDERKAEATLALLHQLLAKDETRTLTNAFLATLTGLPEERFQCRHCRLVFTLMPRGYERRYQTAAREIGAAMVSRLAHRGWPEVCRASEAPTGYSGLSS